MGRKLIEHQVQEQVMSLIDFLDVRCRTHKKGRLVLRSLPPS